MFEPCPSHTVAYVELHVRPPPWIDTDKWTQHGHRQWRSQDFILGGAVICEGAKRPSPSERSERGGGGGGCGRATVGRFFENLCMKTAFSSTLNYIIRGYLCEVAYVPIPYNYIPPFKNLFYSN